MFRQGPFREDSVGVAEGGRIVKRTPTVRRPPPPWVIRHLSRLGTTVFGTDLGVRGMSVAG